MLADLDTVKAAISDRSQWTETILSLSSNFSSFSVGYCKRSLHACKRKTFLDPTDIRRRVSLTWEGYPDNAFKRKDDLHLTTDSTSHKFLTTRLSDWEAAELHSCRNEKSVHCNIFARKDVELYWYHKPGASYLLMLLIKTTLYRLQHHTQSPKVQRALGSTRRCDQNLSGSNQRMWCWTYS